MKRKSEPSEKNTHTSWKVTESKSERYLRKKSKTCITSTKKIIKMLTKI